LGATKGKKIAVVCPVQSRAKISLAKHYSSVMIGAPRLITAASLKWMKWMAAARWSGLRLLFVPDLRRHYARRTMKSGVQFSAVLRSFQD